MSDETQEEMRRKGDGVFVVMEFGYSTPVVVGVADSLWSAMLVTLDAAGFEMLIPAEDGFDSVTVDSGHPEAFQHFRWVDESAYGDHPGYFRKGEGSMTAYFQDEGSSFRVYWRELDVRG